MYIYTGALGKNLSLVAKRLTLTHVSVQHFAQPCFNNLDKKLQVTNEKINYKKPYPKHQAAARLHGLHLPLFHNRDPHH